MRVIKKRKKKNAPGSRAARGPERKQAEEQVALLDILAIQLHQLGGERWPLARAAVPFDLIWGSYLRLIDFCITQL